ncbi:glycosyl hydrolases family 31-domain-containing protein [Xylaria cf. heliscus]|nr:glycosyl hydrolases family 31-domain-containing protein [Xylaria cf. heliscus]
MATLLLYDDILFLSNVRLLIINEDKLTLITTPTSCHSVHGSSKAATDINSRIHNFPHAFAQETSAFSYCLLQMSEYYAIIVSIEDRQLYARLFGYIDLAISNIEEEGEERSPGDGPRSQPFVLTRSTFAGAGSKAAHWFGDNASTWADYRTTISQLLSFASVHATPMEAMCARWALLAAFQPFYRNHADISAPSQELYRWELTKQAARKGIDARHRLLDYIYTAMWRAAGTGSPVVNPLFFLYPRDADTFGIDLQWFYGDALLVPPVTEDDATSVTFYLPDDVFYDFWTLQRVEGRGEAVTVEDVAVTDIPVHIRGGTVLPLRSASGNHGAGAFDVGDEYSDISFTWDGETLKAEGTFGYQTDVVVESVKILGGEEPVTKEGRWSLNEAFEVTVS